MAAESIIHPFNYEGVTLLDGRLKDQYKQVRDQYYNLRSNDMLYGFRKKAGKRAPGREIGGAYSHNATGFAQWMSAFVRMYKATGDTAMRDKALYLMDEWAKTFDKDGFFGYKHPRNPGHYHYQFDKYVGAMVDIYEFTGNTSALKHLESITTWAEKNLVKTNQYALPSEWYTVSENLYRAYELTGNKRYYDFAKVWEYTDFWKLFAQNKYMFQENLKTVKHKSFHAYSHVNTFSGAAMAYRVTGEKHYLDTIKNAYQFLQETQVYAAGGFGPEEQFVVPDGMVETLTHRRRGEANVDIRFHFETSCGSWAAFKLSRYLMSFTGEAHYGDWIERLIYNGVGAMVPMNEYGMIMYGSSYDLPGAQKSLSTVWFCCSGSLPITVTEYHNLIYFYDKDNLYVNLFVPSKVKWNNITLTQKTKFPEEETVQFHVKPKTPSTFGIKFRVPLWVRSGVKVKVNNKTFKTPTVPGKWAIIKRKWNPDDTVTLQFDLSPRIEPLPGYISPAAILAGPVVLVSSTAREEEGWVPYKDGLKFPGDWLIGAGGTIAYSRPSAKANIDPKRDLHTSKMIRPFYEMKTGEHYRMYFEKWGKTILPIDEIKFKGNWKWDGNLYTSKTTGDSFEAEFMGSAVIWEGLRLEDCGIAEVYIDNKKITETDQYGFTGVYVPRLDQREVPFRWSKSGLTKGKHTIKVKITSKKNPSSGGTGINISKLIYYR